MCHGQLNDEVRCAGCNFTMFTNGSCVILLLGIHVRIVYGKPECLTPPYVFIHTIAHKENGEFVKFHYYLTTTGNIVGKYVDYKGVYFLCAISLMFNKLRSKNFYLA